jgi:hypothetical protein
MKQGFDGHHAILCRTSRSRSWMSTVMPYSARTFTTASAFSWGSFPNETKSESRVSSVTREPLSWKMRSRKSSMNSSVNLSISACEPRQSSCLARACETTRRRCLRSSLASNSAPSVPCTLFQARKEILTTGGVDFNRRPDDTLGSSSDHGSKYRDEVVAPGRQDEFHRTVILISGAPTSFVAPLIFFAASLLVAV